MNTTQSFFDISNFLNRIGISSALIEPLNIVVGLVIITILASVSYFIARKIVLRLLHKVVHKTKTKWDDILLEKQVFTKLTHIVPGIILYYSIGGVLSGTFLLLSRGVINIYLIIMVLLAIDAFINSLHHIYSTLEISKSRPIQGYVQVIKITIYFVATILILSVILNKQPTNLFAGLGAIAAILILVFKDTILGFVASIQLSANKMVNVGDWISMPKHNADGDVIDISLNTVKVQNWDKTISTIPTYALVAESFNNWRGMSESGGRRIKRHITLDIKSVKFCSNELIESFKNMHLLKSYIEEKEKEIENYNHKHNINNAESADSKQITNIGTFRKYLEFYLEHNPNIHTDMTFLVRQLQSTEKGVPIEIYVFSNDQVWANYESIQADIFDHILAIVPEFELNIFQSPSADDIINVNML